MSTSLRALGTTFLVGLATGAEQGQGAGNGCNSLAVLGITAVTVPIFTAFSSYTTPEPTPEPTPVPAQPPAICSQDPADPTYRIIPGNNIYTIRTALNETDCQALANTIDQGRDPLTFNAFRTLGDSPQGISPENRLDWQKEFAPNNRYFSWDEGLRSMNNIVESDLPKSAVWGFDEQGHPFIAIKYTIDKVHRCVNLFYHDSDRHDGLLLTASDNMNCLHGPLNTQNFYMKGGAAFLFPYNAITKTLQKLLKGEEVISDDTNIGKVTLELIPEHEAQAAAAQPADAAQQQLASKPVSAEALNSQPPPDAAPEATVPA